jgi:hypothetical protein
MLNGLFCFSPKVVTYLVLVLVHFISYVRCDQLDELRQPHCSLQSRQHPCFNKIIFCPYLVAFHFQLVMRLLSWNKIFEMPFAITSCVHVSYMLMIFTSDLREPSCGHPCRIPWAWRSLDMAVRKLRIQKRHCHSVSIYTDDGVACLACELPIRGSVRK